MARESERDGVRLGEAAPERPEIETDRDAQQGKIGFADDPTNRDPNFTRAAAAYLDAGACSRGRRCEERWRGWRARLPRANAAVEPLWPTAPSAIWRSGKKREYRAFQSFDARAFAGNARGDPASAAATRDRSVRFMKDRLNSAKSKHCCRRWTRAGEHRTRRAEITSLSRPLPAR